MSVDGLREKTLPRAISNKSNGGLEKEGEIGILLKRLILL